MKRLLRVVCWLRSHRWKFSDSSGHYLIRCRRCGCLSPDRGMGRGIE